MALTRITEGVIKPNENYVVNNINSSGVTTSTNFKTGTSNLHNVGIEIAGINVLGADTPIGTGATIYDAGGAVFTGVVTATSFSGSGNIGGVDGNFSGNVTAVDATFTGNVSIGGTLTYEDVTNIDSVGLVTARDGVFIPDNKKLELGNAAGSGDLTIKHFAGGNSYITDTTNDVVIQTGVLRVVNAADNQNLATFSQGGASDLYFAGSQKITTASSGVNIVGTTTTGQLAVTGVTTTGGTVNIAHGTGQAHYQITQSSGNTVKFGIVSGSDVEISGSSNNNIIIKRAGATRLTITTDGATVAPNLTANSVLSSYGGIQTKLGFISGGSEGFVGTISNHSLFIKTNDANRIKIANNSAATSIGGAMAFNAMLTTQGDVSGGLLMLKAAENTNRLFVSGTDSNGVEVNLYDDAGGQKGILGVSGSEFFLKAPNNSAPFKFYNHNGSSVGERLQIDHEGLKLKNLDAGGGISINALNNTSNYGLVVANANRPNENDLILGIGGSWNGDSVAQIDFRCGADTTNKDDGKIMFFTQENNAGNLQERLRITSTGQVKIGNNPTADSNANLHVEDASGECGVWIEGNTGGAGAYLLLKNNSTSSNPKTYIGGVDAGGQGTSQIEFHNLDNGTNEGQLTLHTRPASGSMTERLRIHSDGHLSLRNAGNSHQELRWYSGTSLSASIGWGNGSANWEFKHFRGDSQAGAPYANIDFWTGSSSSPSRALRITEDGMLLLGETNDDGMSSYDLGMKNGRAIRFRNAAGNAWINTLGLDGSNNLKLGWGGSANEIHFGISGIGEQMALDSSGNLLIGRTSWVDNHFDNGIYLAGGTQAGMKFMRTASGSAGTWDIGIDTDRHFKFVYVGDGGGTGVEKLRITSGGNVGINETNPGYPLDIGYTDNTAWQNGAIGNGVEVHNKSTTAGTAAGIHFYATGNGANAAASHISCVHTANGTGDMSFANRHNAGSHVERMRLHSEGILKVPQGVDDQGNHGGHFYSPHNTGYVGTRWTEQGAAFVFYMGELVSGSSSNASSNYVNCYTSHHWGDYPRLIIWAHERYYRCSSTTWTFGCYGGTSRSHQLVQTSSWGSINGGHGTDNAGSVSVNHAGHVATYSGSQVHRYDLTMSNTGTYGYTRWYIGVLKPGARGLYSSAASTSTVDSSSASGGCTHLKTMSQSQFGPITYLG